MTSPSHRRLLKEASELASHPSPHFTAHPVSDSNLYDWHFTLAGPPPPSPYSGGIYHGRIVLPPTYPLRPPSFRFLTPSGRFEVNREICLSISGHHEETWQPAWGIRTALLALRSFMDADAKGQVGGLDVDVAVRRRYAVESRGWVCDVCEGGRSNEEVLREWREVCRAKGVVVEDDEDATNTLGAGATAERTASGEAEPNPERQQSDIDANANAKTNTETATSRRESESLLSKDAVPQQQVQVQVQVPSASVAAPAEAAAPAPMPTRTTPLRTTTATTSRPTTSDALWLDRAILGVLVALAFMIVRRFAKSEEY